MRAPNDKPTSHIYLHVRITRLQNLRNQDNTLNCRSIEAKIGAPQLESPILLERHLSLYPRYCSM